MNPGDHTALDTGTIGRYDPASCVGKAGMYGMVGGIIWVTNPIPTSKLPVEVRGHLISADVVVGADEIAAAERNWH